MTHDDRKLADKIYGDSEVQKGLLKLNELLRGSNISFCIFIGGRDGKVYGGRMAFDSKDGFKKQMQKLTENYEKLLEK